MLIHLPLDGKLILWCVKSFGGEIFANQSISFLPKKKSVQMKKFAAQCYQNNSVNRTVELQRMLMHARKSKSRFHWQFICQNLSFRRIYFWIIRPSLPEFEKKLSF